MPSCPSFRTHIKRPQKSEPQPSVSAALGSAVIEKMDLILTPVRVATSKPARQTYLNTFLFMVTSSILLGLAVFAYILFYLNYVPQIGIERVIHLQYGDGPHPYGIAALDSSLISQQPYDIIVSLNVPRSPTNIAQGNFMLSLSLLPPTYKPALPVASTSVLKRTNAVSEGEMLFFSRRPTILTYTSRLVSLSERLFSLPLYILGLRQESEILHIPMAESQSFPKGWKNVPGYVMLEVQAGQEVQVYDVRVLFTAQFGGIRWLMYNHRILSFLIFTSAFWFSEIIFTLLGWVAVQTLFSSKTEAKKELVKVEETDASTVKAEGGEETDGDEPDLSDTPRTYPTYGRQAPLRFVPKIKEEDSEEFIMDETAIQPLTAEADDEDEELEVYKGGRDSGIGTSFSEAGERSGVARRRSRGGK